MTTTRRFHLPMVEHPVSWIDADTYPDPGGCHIICLSDRQCAIIRDMVSAKAYWPTRFASHLHGEQFTYGDPTVFAEHKLEVNELFEQIGEGSSVACTELVTALSDLAAALSAAQAGSGGQNIINCGSGCGTGVAGATGGLISGLTYEELAGPEPIVEPDPEGDPPEGFATWDEYRTLKCQGAHYVFDAMVRSLNVLNTLSGVLGSLATVTPMIMYYLAATTAVAPMIDVVAIALAVIPFLVLAIGAAYSTASAIAYLEDNKDLIICAMYESGSAQEVIEVAANAIEDAAETIEWSGLLSGLGSVLAPAMATAASSMITTNVVNAMFHLVEDIVYPDVTCECVGAYDGYLQAQTCYSAGSQSGGYTIVASDRIEILHTENAVTALVTGNQDGGSQTPLTWCFDLGSEVVSANSIQFKALSGGGYYQVAYDYSLDGEAWTVWDTSQYGLLRYTDGAWNDLNTHALPSTPTMRYLRLKLYQANNVFHITESLTLDAMRVRHV